MHRLNRITIDLNAICFNYRLMAEYVPRGVRVMAVVKANAYGHGMQEVAKAVIGAGCGDLAVAIPEEGIALREAGIQGTNILVLGAIHERAIEACLEHDLTLTVFEPGMVEKINACAERMHMLAHVHIKLDTGMSRIGLRTADEASALRQALAKASHVMATGVYTHFADADHLNENGALCDYSHEQLQLFLELKALCGAELPAHASNSAMSLICPQANFSMTREGISLYGYPPVPTHLPFRPALRWEAEIVYVKNVPAGTCIGYGCTYTAQKSMRVATIACGYGDGYHRMVSNRGCVLVHGKRAPVVGRVCMDQIMVDTTDIPQAQAGDIAVLIGTQEDGFIGADELAAWADTISYEVLLSITARVHRVYVPVDGAAAEKGE